MRIYGNVGGRMHPCDQPTVKQSAPKRCSRCGLTKPARSFAKHNGGKLKSMCRECKRDYDRERYRRMKERAEEERHFMERVM